MVRYCRARVGGEEKTIASADDVAQEVCLAVLTALPSYRDQGRPFLAFVFGIASHKVADAHRSAARDRAQSVSETPDVSEFSNERVVHGEFAEPMGRVAKFLDTLSDKQRDVVYLRVVVGLSAEETAEAVGSTPGAVRVAQHRAMARLRALLTSKEGPDHFVRGQVRQEPPPEQFTAQEWDMELSDDDVSALQIFEAALARP